MVYGSAKVGHKVLLKCFIILSVVMLKMNVEEATYFFCKIYKIASIYKSY